MARACACARLSGWWHCSASTICAPIVNAGFSDDIGSWKIIAIALPRSACSSAAGRPTSSRPSKRIEPAATRPGGRTRPMMDSDVTLLPQPDSPTMASVRPASTLKSMPSTAAKLPWSVANSVRRPVTSSSAIVFSPPPGVRGRR